MFHIARDFAAFGSLVCFCTTLAVWGDVLFPSAESEASARSEGMVVRRNRLRRPQKGTVLGYTSYRVRHCRRWQKNSGDNAHLIASTGAFGKRFTWQLILEDAMSA